LTYVIGGLLVSSAAQGDADCERAATVAEHAWHLPPGLLLAVGRVESGRWDAARGQLVPWPWSIDVAGQGRQFTSKFAAVQSARATVDSGIRNVDVGCFQVNLLHHPTAFSDLDQALDPTANAQYAAHFLTAMHDRLGGWERAVAAYHSADPALGKPYQQLVYASWSDPASAPPVEMGVHVWTPAAPGTAPEVIVLHAATTPLPRIVTPSN
jgi:hypothetical protein